MGLSFLALSHGGGDYIFWEIKRVVLGLSVCLFLGIFVCLNVFAPWTHPFKSICLVTKIFCQDN